MNYFVSFCLCVPALLVTALASADDAQFAQRRAEMVALIEDDVRRTAQYTGLGRFDKRVMDVMADVPRHRFVPVDRAE